MILKLYNKIREYNNNRFNSGKYNFYSTITLEYTLIRIKSFGVKYAIIDLYEDFKGRDTLYYWNPKRRYQP